MPAVLHHMAYAVCRFASFNWFLAASLWSAHLLPDNMVLTLVCQQQGSVNFWLCKVHPTLSFLMAPVFISPLWALLSVTLPLILPSGFNSALSLAFLLPDAASFCPVSALSHLVLHLKLTPGMSPLLGSGLGFSSVSGHLL